MQVTIGVLLAAGASFGLAELFSGSQSRNVLPLCFIAVLYLLSWRFGVEVGVIGAFLCAGIFAHFLFAPTGSWHVEDAVARRNLAWMVAGSIALVYLLVPSKTPHNKS